MGLHNITEGDGSMERDLGLLPRISIRTFKHGLVAQLLGSYVQSSPVPSSNFSNHIEGLRNGHGIDGLFSRRIWPRPQEPFRVLFDSFIEKTD